MIYICPLPMFVIKVELCQPSFRPDWVSAPCDTIIDILDMKYPGWNDETFASLIEVDLATAQDILADQTSIAPHTAKLAEAFGGIETFWIERERQYRDALREHKAKS